MYLKIGHTVLIEPAKSLFKVNVNCELLILTQSTESLKLLKCLDAFKHKQTKLNIDENCK